MAETNPLPKFKGYLSAFVADLREGAFRVQTEVAVYVNLTHATISRYENGHIKPPVGYIALLAMRYIDKRARREQDVGNYRKTLLQEVNKALRELYANEMEFQDWRELSELANDYLAERRGNRDKSVPKDETASKVDRRQEWGEAPDVGIFFGREAELAELERWIIEDNCHLVAILGLGGIGKTTLARKLAEQIQDRFEVVIWRSIINTPPVEEILGELIPILSDQQEVHPSGDLDKHIARFITCLDKHRCLVILDNVEAIMEEGHAGYFQKGHEAYQHLFQSAANRKHQSCILLTSREKPADVGRLEGTARTVRSMRLSELDLDAGRRVLESKDLSGSDENLRTLIESYSGNPLALGIVAELIREVYFGNIDRFLMDGEIIPEGISDVIGEQFERLSGLEQSLMYWLAIEREPVSQQRLRENLIQPVLQGEIAKALLGLRRRSLVERSSSGFMLQNIVMGYLTNRLAEEIAKEISSEKLLLFETHALIKAQTKDYIRAIQSQLILKSVVERLLVTLDKDEIAEKLEISLTKIQKTQPPKRGYAGGNAINTLIYLGQNLSGRDFSHLAIWQANLRDVDLYNVNFAYSDLATSVFKESFGTTTEVAFSLDGQLFGAGTANGDIRLWQTEDGSLQRTFEGHDGWIWSIAFDPDGHIFASGSGDKSVRLWDVKTEECLRILQGHSGQVWSVAFSPDGTIVASGSSDKTIRIWSVDTGQCLHKLENHSDEVWSVTFSPDGNTLTSSSRDKTIQLWDTRTQKVKRKLTGHTERVRTLAYSPDGNILASGGDDDKIILWEVKTGRYLRILRGHTSWVKSVAFNHRGSILASGSEDHNIRLWNVHSGECLKILRGHTNRVRSVAFNDEDSILVSGSGDQTVRLWDVKTGRNLKVIKGYVNRIWSIAFSPDGHLVASGNEDRIIRLWDARTGKCLEKLRGHTNRVRSVTFSPDGSILASSGGKKNIRLWNTNTGECLRVLSRHTDFIKTLAFSPDSDILASGSEDRTIRLWDVNSGECLHVLTGHTNRVRSVAFHPADRLLASGSEDRTIRLWDIATKNCLSILEGHSGQIRSVAFSPDGNILASGSEDQTIRLWDVNSGECLHVLTGHTNRVWSVAFSPDSNLLVSGGEDQTIRLWEVKSRKCLKELSGHTSWIWSVTFSPDGSTFASCGDDETIIFWDIESNRYIKRLRADRPYERMNITGVTGLTDAQKVSLKALGAVEL